MDDAIDAAIVAAGTQPEVPMRRVAVAIASTGRPVGLEMPADLSDTELIELCGWMLTAMRRALRDQRAGGSRLLVPRGVHS